MRKCDCTLPFITCDCTKCDDCDTLWKKIDIWIKKQFNKILTKRKDN